MDRNEFFQMKNLSIDTRSEHYSKIDLELTDDNQSPRYDNNDFNNEFKNVNLSDGNGSTTRRTSDNKIGLNTYIAKYRSKSSKMVYYELFNYYRISEKR